jgi:LysM repeat protein
LGYCVCRCQYEPSAINEETTIRSLPELASRTTVLTRPAEFSNTLQKNRLVSRYVKKHRKRLVRYSLLASNVAVLLLVSLFVIKQPNNTQGARNDSVSALGRSTVNANPLDRLSSADIAVHAARLANLEERTAVANNADSINAQLSLAPADDTVIAKPQVVNTATKTNKDIRRYTVNQGDTINALADRFGVPSDTIRWSNNLTGNNLTPGKVILIPPDGTNAIVYTVKTGDTVDSLAQRYRTNKDLITVTNDAELTGIKVGQLILIPNGVVVPVAQYTPSVFTASFGGGGYDYGYCTWWAAKRRVDTGHPVPSNLGNASTWKIRSQMAGIPVGTVPRAGAVIWTVPRDYYGHVGFVESVNSDGSVNISDMNVAGWNRVSYRTLTPAQAAAYYYIYW